MLSLALGATLVGFALLVVALTTSNLPLAIACVVVCLIGLILLLVDTLRANRRGVDGEDEEPLFTIRGRESAVREEPLDDHQALDDEPTVDDSRPWVDDGDRQSSGLASLVKPAADRRPADADQLPSGGFAPISGGFALPDPALPDPALPDSALPDPAPAPAESAGGDVNDYLRATGSFPAQAAPIPPAAATPAPEPEQTPVPDSYIGRRRLGDDIVVRSADSDLPAMQFVWEDPDEKPKGD